MSEEMKNEKVQETMEDFAAELEASYKEYDEKRSQAYVADETPDAEKWQEVKQLQADHAVVNVKIKEIVKGGAVAYLDELRAFIPASQLALDYVEDTTEFVGKTLEVRVITVDSDRQKLVLSAKDVLKEKEAERLNHKISMIVPGTVVEGRVESLMPYGAFVDLGDGLSGLVHISQISTQRIKHPGAVLKEGQTVKVKILSIADGKISLSMKALIQQETEEEEHETFDYKETASATTGLGDLLKGLKL